MKLLVLCSLLALTNANSITNLFAEVQNDLQKPFNGTIWVVLVAGSNEWYNYRHQADVCHAYQVLHEHGIPDKNIIVMMYDDIAYSSENPKPGFIRNKPGGRNVYPGVPKDYTAEEVTPENFLAVLGGSEQLESKGKKVVKSGPNDHIFVYFSDHGAPGLIAFPNSELKATDLNKLLKKMHSQRKYNKLVLYIEACESGSMFDGLLPRNIDIFATTAANSQESSYACYYDKELDTYLGDVYSVKWIEDSDNRASLKLETLQQQFRLVKKETNTSHVQEFGDLRIGKLPLSQFQGPKTEKREINDNQRTPITDAVPGPDVPIILAAKKARREKNGSVHHRKELESMLAARDFMNASVAQIVEKIRLLVNSSFSTLWNVKQPLRNHKCYEEMYQTFDRYCFDLSSHPYGLRFLYVFNNFCRLTNDRTTIKMAQNVMTQFCEKNIVRRPLRRIL